MHEENSFLRTLLSRGQVGGATVLGLSIIIAASIGSYDTGTIDKQVMVTARAVFFLR